jgi:hypothetical protein
MDDYVYHVTSTYFYKGGDLNPKKSKFKKKLIKDFFKLWSLFDKHSFEIKRRLPPPPGSGDKEKIVDERFMIKVSKKDLGKQFIHLTSSYRSAKEYYGQLKGGAMVNTILYETNQILGSYKPSLAKSEFELVKRLNKWAEKAASKDMILVKIRADCKALNGSIISPLNSNKEEKAINFLDSFKDYENQIVDIILMNNIPKECIEIEKI